MLNDAPIPLEQEGHAGRMVIWMTQCTVVLPFASLLQEMKLKQTGYHHYHTRKAHEMSPLQIIDRDKNLTRE